MRNPLDGELPGEPRSCAGYEHCSGSVNAALLDEISAPYFDGTLRERFSRTQWGGEDWDDCFDRRVKEVKTLLLAKQGCDPNEFLDAMVAHVAERRDSLCGTLHALFDPVLQAFYDLGHNDLVLDLREIDYDLTAVCCNLVGTETRPVRLSCLATDAIQVADYTSHCDITFRGKCLYMGAHGHLSRYDCSGSQVQYPGYFAERCTFIIQGGWDSTLYPYTYRSNYYIESGADDSLVDRLKDYQFFTRKNRIFVPDGRGGWKGVKP